MTQRIVNCLTQVFVGIHILYYLLIFSLVVVFPIVMIYKGLIK